MSSSIQSFNVKSYSFAPTNRPARSSSIPPSDFSTWSNPVVAHCATALASAGPAFNGRAFEGYREGGGAGLDATAGDDRAPAVSATVYGWRPRESAWRTRSLPREHRVSYPWHQSTADDRDGSFLRLLPTGKSRRYRSI